MTTNEPGSAVALASPQQVQVTPGGFSLVPRNLDEAFRLADLLADSELVPKDYRGKPANILVAVQWGAEVGLQPLQALAGIAVINGRPSLWGDALIALVRHSPLCEYIIESFDPAGTAVCQVKRRGEPEQIRTFSMADAQVAGLKGKGGPWTTNPKRMLQMRARAFALRDVFPDVLKGMPVAEEVIDTPVETSAPTPLDQIAGLAPPVPADLLKRAQDAAELGMADYAEFWANGPKGTTKEERKLLQNEHGGLRLRAAEVDAEKKKAEVVEDVPTTTGEHADFIADLDKADSAGEAG